MTKDPMILDPDTGVRYGFHDRLRAEFPSQIIADITEVCNLACIHSTHPAFKKSAYYAGRSLDLALNVKLVNEMRQNRRNCTQYVRYASDGKPLIHRHIFDMLDYGVSSSQCYLLLRQPFSIANWIKNEI
jgi:MoaA/NifB/PqqE/SkfB family radical SAM enzyme